MKIALCLSGQMRTYRECYKNLKKYLIDPLNPDVFIHTWDDIGISHKESQIFDIKEKKIRYNDLEQLYKPKSVVIEEFNSKMTFTIDKIVLPQILIDVEPNNYRAVLPQCYKIYKCNELKKDYEYKNNFKYDVVIRLRPDIKIYNKIEINMLNNRKILWMAFYTDYLASDQFAFSSSENMDIFSSVFTKLTEYWNDPIGMNPPQTHKVGIRLLRHHLSFYSEIEKKVISNSVCRILRFEDILKSEKSFKLEVLKIKLKKLFRKRNY